MWCFFVDLFIVKMRSRVCVCLHLNDSEMEKLESG